MVYFLDVFFECSIRCYKDVIHVDSVVSRIYLRVEGVVHEALEGGGGVAQSEEHHHRLK